MPPGGILVIDDVLLPSVAATITYMAANLKQFERIALTDRFVAYVKVSTWRVGWNFFRPFSTDFTANSGKHHWYIKNHRAILEKIPSTSSGSAAVHSQLTYPTR